MGARRPWGFAPWTPARAGGPCIPILVFAEGGGLVGAGNSGVAHPLQRKPRIGMQGPPALAGVQGAEPLGLLAPSHASTRVPLRAGQAAATPGRPRNVTRVRVKLLMVPWSARKRSSTAASR